MEIIDYKDIKFKKLKVFDHQGHNSIIYDNGDELIKIFKGYSNDERFHMFEKFKTMEDIQIDGIIKPDKFIVKKHFKFGKDKQEYVGYTMKKFHNSVSIYEYFPDVREYDCADLFKVLKKASLILQDIHKNQIICKDVSFLNILFDRDDLSDVKICDIDDCFYRDKKHCTEQISCELQYYYEHVMGDRFATISLNSDKLSMILSLLYLLFYKEIDEISDRDYDEVAEKINTLKNLREFFIPLRAGEFNLIFEDLPYLHEIIDDKDSHLFKNF